MSYLSSGLTKVLADLDWSQKRLADLTGIQPSRINRYARGSAVIGSDALRAIIEALPRDRQGELLAAHLKDAIPDGLSDLVTVLPTGTPPEPGTPPDSFPIEADPHLRKVVQTLARQAVEQKEIRDMLCNFERLIHPAS